VLTLPAISVLWEKATTITAAYQLEAGPPLYTHCSSDPFHYTILLIAASFCWTGKREEVF